jgi:hypothetical protein
MKSLTEHLWFETPHRRDYLNITGAVEQLVRKSGVEEGLCLVNAMHITLGHAQQRLGLFNREYTHRPIIKDGAPMPATGLLGREPLPTA